MSDRIRSKDGKYEGVLDVTDGNFVVRRVADGKQISTLGPKPTPSASVSPCLDKRLDVNLFWSPPG